MGPGCSVSIKNREGEVRNSIKNFLNQQADSQITPNPSLVKSEVLQQPFKNLILI